MTTRRPQPQSHGDYSPIASTGYGQTILFALMSETLDELEIKKRTIGVSSSTILYTLYDFVDVDFASALSGQAPAVAAGIKHAHPTRTVFSFQLASEVAGQGMGLLFSTLERQDPITMIFADEVDPGRTATLPAILGKQTKVQVDLIRLDSVASLERVKAALSLALTRPLKTNQPHVLQVVTRCPTTWKISHSRAQKLISAAQQREAIGVLAAGGKHS